MNVEPETIDYERFMKLRLVVARFGEMDNARWWNTQGMLGKRGAAVLRRGFLRTHYFAQARSVFAVARVRCHELFDPPGCMTLWHLPAEIEDSFEEYWQTALDNLDQWPMFFEQLAPEPGPDLLETLTRFELISPAQKEDALKLRRSAENRAVPLAGLHCPCDDSITLLAAGFFRGEPGACAIPYARLEA